MIRASIRERLEGKRDLRRLFRRNSQKAVVDERDVRPLVRDFYKKRDWRPAWVRGNGPTNRAQEMARLLAAVTREGLAPSDYDARGIAAAIDSLEPGLFEGAPPALALARLDVMLTREFFQYASHRYGGRVDPRALPAAWHVKPRRQDLVPVLEQALESGQIEAALAELDPKHPQYAPLRAALGRFVTVVETGGWEPIPAGRLRPGSRGPAVALLRARLAATGELDPNLRLGAVYDGSVENAVRTFQERYGLEPDGVVDADDRAALNVSAQSRMRQVALAMEKLRWMPDLDDSRVLIVNIPEFALRVREAGREILAMRVVVGKDINATPIFFDKITHVILNPPWNVPASIVEKEILPALENDPSYLERNGMQYVEGDRIQQLPGDGNALGRIKFEMPNKYDIYLHDTPAKHLFARAERSFSHGCIRVERPVDLATLLLAGSKSQADIEAGIATGETKWIPVPRPMPVRLVYDTAWVDGNGGVHFREDLYGLDRKIDAAWTGRTASR